jgi:hypothetical protein
METQLIKLQELIIKKYSDAEERNKYLDGLNNRLRLKLLTNLSNQADAETKKKLAIVMETLDFSAYYDILIKEFNSPSQLTALAKAYDDFINEEISSLY